MLIKTRRSVKIVSVSYVLAAFAVLGGFIFTQYMRAEGYKRQVTSSRSRVFSQFVTEVRQLDAALQKCVLAGTPSMLAGVSADVYGRAEAARAALYELPISEADSERVSGLITKTGERAYLIARKAGMGGTLEQGELEELRKLLRAVTDLSCNLETLLARFKSGGQQEEFPEMPPIAYEVTAGEKSEKTAPTLLEGKSLLERNAAAGSAAAFMGIRRGSVKFEGEGDSVVPVYVFSTGGGKPMSIEVTKQGGYVVSVSSAYAPLRVSIRQEDAIKKAGEFLKSNGYHNMRTAVAKTEGSTVLIDFVYEESGIIYYPDRIRVRVELDEGTVTGFSCADYIINHHARDYEKPAVSAEAARENVSKRLEIITHSLAVIAGLDGAEVFCHEFECKDDSNRRCTVYINAETAEEEQIIIPGSESYL